MSGYFEAKRVGFSALYNARTCEAWISRDLFTKNVRVFTPAS